MAQPPVPRLVGKTAKMDPPDVVRTLNYRSGFFGGPFSAVLQSVMRGQSAWTVGERELFAAYTSYRAVASTVLGKEITQAVFMAPETAPISPQLKAALGLVRKLTLAPEEVGADDLRATLDAGVSQDGVIDALYVCFAFNLIDRVPDALGFDLVDEEDTARRHRSCSSSGTSSRRRFGCRHGTRPGRPRTPRCVRYRAMGGRSHHRHVRPVQRDPRAAWRWSPPDL